MANKAKTTVKKKRISRRATIKGIGAAGALAILGKGAKGATGPAQVSGGTIEAVASGSTVRDAIFEKVSQTVFIDTHEHIITEEKVRLSSQSRGDWTILFSGYFASDMLTAGMPKKDHDKFFSDKVDIADKWRLIEPYWPAIKNTGYGQAARISIKELYGVEEFSTKAFVKIQSGYEKLKKPGFYRYVLNEKANVESCQVNSIVPPFVESQYRL